MKKVFLTIFLGLIFCITEAQVTYIVAMSPEGKDANCRNDHPDNNYGSSVDFIANAFTYLGDFFVQRSFMEFDLSGIPANAVVTHAKLSLYCNTTTGHAQYQYGDNTCVLNRVTENWEENTLNWNNQPAVAQSNKVILPASTSQFQDYPDIDITAMVRDMIADPSSSFGIRISLMDEERYRTMVFASGDHADPAKRPVLVVNYDTCQLPRATASFTWQSETGNSVSFNNASQNSDTWHWDFGDGSISEEQNPVHAYPQAGNYIVCLTASNECSSSVLCDSVVLCTDIQPAFSYTIINDSIVHFNNTTLLSAGHSWDFGDGTSSAQSDPTHTFTAPGTYNVCLTEMNSCDTAVLCQAINICLPAVSNFRVEMLNDTIARFFDESLNASAWLWSFGDGSSSSLQNPIHIYSDPGNYQACLQSINVCGSNSSCQNVTICQTVTSNFSYENKYHGSFQFTDASVNASEWLWDFGDGSTSSLQNPEHTFESPDTFNVCLRSSNGCMNDHFCQQVIFEQDPLKSPYNPVIIYPNPSQTGYTIQLPEAMSVTKVKITDLNGNVVYEIPVEPGTKELKIPSQSEGIYFLNLLVGNSPHIFKIFAR